ncbi:MAG: calcium/sodium antiporter [Trueperaceae bacterium]|nr:calcium/sodium antiporter [Trueperaceae bacterium]
MSIVLLLVGFVLLVLGGDVLVRSASSLAARLGISPLAIGLTVVAFGTSAPELAATLASSLQGVPDLGVGNVIGSNIANIGLILGAAAILAPIGYNAAFVRRDVPVSLLALALLVPLMLDGRLGRVDGLLLLTALGIYLALLIRHDRNAVADEVPGDAAASPLWRSVGGVVLGVGFLVLGADAVVRGAVQIAGVLGVPERVIGLTMVAFGTSLPELASSVAAAARRQADMILGNIAGSNIFNVLAVLGTAAGATVIPVSLAEIGTDLVVAGVFALAILPVMVITGRLGRIAGVALLAGYLAYVVTLFVPA